MSRASVLVVSDTHLRVGSALPVAVLELADRADHVLHGGDVTTADVLATFEALAPVTAACGNCDDAEVASRLPNRAVVELAGVSVAIVHDAGPAAGRHERLHEQFPDAQVVVYGHSHQPELVQASSGQWIVNPGSPTQRRRAPTHTVAWLELESGTVRGADLVHLD